MMNELFKWHNFGVEALGDDYAMLAYDCKTYRVNLMWLIPVDSKYLLFPLVPQLFFKLKDDAVIALWDLINEYAKTNGRTIASIGDFYNKD